jgi:hypothetical protein
VATTTTSTSLPPGTCATIPDGPTFESIACRLAALLEQIRGEGGLAFLQRKLEKKLELLVRRTDEAVVACRQPKPPRVNTRLKQVSKGLGAYQHRLGTLKARKKIPAEIREPLIAAADPIRTDTDALRAAVSCPDDAPPL